MAHSFHQLHYHLVFAVAHRDAAIHPLWQNRLYEYMAGAIKGLNGYPVIIGGMSDHVHVLVSLSPSESPSDFVKNLKVSSTKWINDNKMVCGHFRWQEGCGYFSVSHRDLEMIRTYIANQQEHHRKRSFMEEYRLMMDRSDKSYDETQIFKPLR